LKVNVFGIDYLKSDENELVFNKSGLKSKLENVENHDNSELDLMISENNDVLVNICDLNQFNIVINDNDCSDTFFEDICSGLRDAGLEFKITKNCEDISPNSGIVITLDQQYSSGASNIIFAPYDNSRVGYSDALALSMKAAFDKKNSQNKIMCGKAGYREIEGGKITKSIPTETEEKLENDSDISFVTISFGTQAIESEEVVECLLNGLLRQRCYLDNYDIGADLIYRANSSDSLENIADYFDTDASSLGSYNRINDGTHLDSYAIINPKVESMPVFSKDLELKYNNSFSDSVIYK